MLKELIDGTLERDFTKASNAYVWGLFFIKNVHEGVFKHLVLNSTINRVFTFDRDMLWPQKVIHT